jgi:hypothetical protein
LVPGLEGTEGKGGVETQGPLVVQCGIGPFTLDAQAEAEWLVEQAGIRNMMTLV